MSFFTPAATQAATTLRVPSTSTAYSSSREVFGPGVTIAARWTTVSTECSESAFAEPFPRTSCFR